MHKDNIENDREIQEEINILHSLKHEHIVQFISVYNDPDAYYIVMELLQGGELYERLEVKTMYEEYEARDVYRCILRAIAYCHDHNIAHRDIRMMTPLQKSFQIRKYIIHQRITTSFQ